jgi:hypothetical protein
MASKEYELLADSFNETTSKPGEPFTFKAYRKGDKIKLDETRAAELIEAGAVAAPSSSRKAAKPGAQTEAPKGKAEGVGDGDADEGTIGDGGPDPQGTGSTSTGDGGGAGDGQGSATDSAAASDAQPPSTQGSGSRSRGRRS